MNWTDFILGAVAGVVFILLWIVSVIVFAVKNQKAVTSFMMKRMMRTAVRKQNGITTVTNANS